jgi:hypothetical protein
LYSFILQSQAHVAEEQEASPQILLAVSGKGKF